MDRLLFSSVQLHLRTQINRVMRYCAAVMLSSYILGRLKQSASRLTNSPLYSKNKQRPAMFQSASNSKLFPMKRSELSPGSSLSVEELSKEWLLQLRTPAPYNLKHPPSPTVEHRSCLQRRPLGAPIHFNETSLFIKQGYYHYYHCVFPHAAAPAMTAHNLIITINLYRNRTQSSRRLYGQRSPFQRLITT